MFKNYIKTAVRSILRNRSYALINMLGLTLGITTCMLIFLMIQHELSFDKMHSDIEQIYRVVNPVDSPSGMTYNASTPYPMGEALRKDLQIDASLLEQVTQIHDHDEGVIRVDNEKFQETQILFADSNFFDVFNYGNIDQHVVIGNIQTALNQPNTAVLTEKTAKKYFQQPAQALGKTINIGNYKDLEVKAVVKDLPINTHLPFNLLVSFQTFDSAFIGGLDIGSWGMKGGGYCYVKAKSDISTEEIHQGLEAIRDKYFDEEERKREEFLLQPLADIHSDMLYASDNLSSTVNPQNLLILGIIGFFILMIACINYINLATALSIKKSKEVGVRKVLGASKTQLVRHFMGEAFVLTLFSVLFSLGLTERILPYLNDLLEKEISYQLLSEPTHISFVLGITVFVSLLAGLYPAFVLTRFQPIQAIKNKVTGGKKSYSLRQVLVVTQFLIAQVLLIGTLVISQQMEFFQSKPLGFDPSTALKVYIPEPEKEEKLDAFRSRVLANPNIETVSFGIGAPIDGSNIRTGFVLSSDDPNNATRCFIKTVDYHYKAVYDLEMKAGRWFTENENKGETYYYVINETAAKKLGFDNPEEIVGQNITTGIGDIDAEVIGIVKDFHTTSLHESIQPIVLMHFPRFYYTASLKISTSNTPQTLATIKKEWEEIFPNFLYDYTFVDDQIAKLYEEEARTFQVFQLFAGISIFIGCLGLFGLISFIVLQRAKEVGIRKVLGASVFSIVQLFSQEFIKLILIAFVFAAPISWFATNYWLEAFAYHIEVGIGVFAVAIVLSALVALLTVSLQSIKAAVVNPIKSLRDD